MHWPQAQKGLFVLLFYGRPPATRGLGSAVAVETAKAHSPLTAPGKQKKAAWGLLCKTTQSQNFCREWGVYPATENKRGVRMRRACARTHPAHAAFFCCCPSTTFSHTQPHLQQRPLLRSCIALPRAAPHRATRGRQERGNPKTENEREMLIPRACARKLSPYRFLLLEYSLQPTPSPLCRLAS